MHGLGTLTRGTQRILATSPLRRRLSPQRKPPQRQREPGADGARRSGGSQQLVFELDEPTFAPTYRTWTVEYTDGTSKVFEV